MTINKKTLSLIIGNWVSIVMLMFKKIFLLFVLCLLCLPSTAYPLSNSDQITRDDIRKSLVSPINGKKINTSSVDEEYSFFVAGHLYGNYHHKKSVYPSATILANIGMINSSDAVFFMGLGDNFRYFEEPYISLFKSSFVDRLNIPFFNTVGNHGLDEGLDKYVREFGITYFSFKLGSEFFLVMDTGTQAVEYISEEQLQFIESSLKEAESDEDIKNIFIFTHKLIWAQKNDEKFAVVFEKTNIGNINNYFKSRIYPHLLRIGKNKRIFIGSGDIGHISPPIFYHQDSVTNITYFAVGIEDSNQDTMLKIVIDENSDVRFVTIPLAGEKSARIEEYGFQMWKNFNKPKIHWGSKNQPKKK